MPGESFGIGQQIILVDWRERKSGFDYTDVRTHSDLSRRMNSVAA
jgi:hypothetical protein